MQARRSFTPRGLLIFALAWQAGSLVSDPLLWPWMQVSLAASVLLWLSIAALVVSGIAVLRESAKQTLVLTVNVSMSAIAALFLLAQDNPLVVSEWRAGASLVNVTVALIGLWLPSARALVLIGGIAVVEAVILLARGSYTNELVPWENDIMYPFFAIVIGFSASVVRSSLERAHVQSQKAFERTESANRETLIAQTAETYIRTREVRIHEVVLNTITAFARGGLTNVNAETVRIRAREAAEVLSELVPSQMLSGDVSHGSLSDVLSDLVTRAREVGIDVHLTGNLPGSLPEDVREMIVDAAREALLNAITHSGARHVTVTVRERSKGVRLVVHDDGDGFDRDLCAAGFGLTSVLGDAVQSCAGEIEIESAPGSGCTVTVEWEGDGPRLEQDLLVQERTGVLRPVLGVFYLFALISTIVTFPRIVNPAGLLVSLLLLALISLSLIALVRRDQLNLLWSLVLAICGAGVYLLQSISVDSADSTWGEWGSEAASVVMFSIAVAGPRLVWPIVIVIWLVVQGDVVNEIFAPGTIFIAVGALLGEILRRAARRTSVQQVKARESEVRLAAAESVVARLSARQRILQHAGTVDLLERVSNGEVLWNESSAYPQWIRHDRFLRSTLRLDPLRNSLHEFLAELVVQAWDGGIDLDVALTNWDVDAVIPQQARDEALAVIASVAVGSHGRCTLAHEGTDVVVRLVVTSSATPLGSWEGTSTYVEVDAAGGAVIWECRAAVVETE